MPSYQIPCECSKNEKYKNIIRNSARREREEVKALQLQVNAVDCTHNYLQGSSLPRLPPQATRQLQAKRGAWTSLSGAGRRVKSLARLARRNFLRFNFFFCSLLGILTHPLENSCQAQSNSKWGVGRARERGRWTENDNDIALFSLFTTRGAQNLCGKRFNFSSSSTFFFLGLFHIFHYVFIKLRKTERRRRLIQSKLSVESVSLEREREREKESGASSNGINLSQSATVSQSAPLFQSCTVSSSLCFFIFFCIISSNA